MRSREEQRDEQRRFEGDVVYEVWRGGGNPDRINDDGLADAYYSGRYAEDVAAEELRHQRQRREPEEDQCPQEQFPDDDAECPRCHGDGMDPMCDYLLPCPLCQGEQQP